MSSALSGGSLSCSSSPLSESALICSSFSPRRFGQLGLQGGAAPIVFQLLIRGMSLLVLARIGVRVTLPGRRRICGSIVFGQNALMPMVQALRAGPSGEERCTPHYTVPVSPQCPQEISLLTLPVFQGAAFSSERFSSAQKCSGAGRLATPSGVNSIQFRKLYWHDKNIHFVLPKH